MVDRHFPKIDKPYMRVGARSQNQNNDKNGDESSNYSKDLSGYPIDSNTQQKLFKMRKIRNPSANMVSNQNRYNDKNTIEVPEEMENTSTLNTKPLLKIKKGYSKGLNTSLASPYNKK